MSLQTFIDSIFSRGPVWTIVVIGLLAAFVSGAAAADYEKMEVLSAADVLSPDLLKGPYHSVDPAVENDGLLNHYKVTSPFAEFTVGSTAALRQLVGELSAVAVMKTVETDDTAVASLKDSGEKTLTGIKNLFTDTEDTLKGAATGVQSLFNRAKETIGSREITDSEDNRAKQLIGFSKAKGEIASSYNVNVYSGNQVLQEELERLAWADYLGGIGVGLATSVVPGVGGLVISASGTARLLNEAINTTPASELWVQNRDKLIAMGLDGDTVQLFLNNQIFSPALTTVMTAALESMKGVGNRDLFLKISLQASTAETARFLTEMTVLYAAYHQRVKPLANFVPLARITRADAADGSAVVVLPADYLIWSEKVAAAAQQVAEEAGGAAMAREFWLTGIVSERARRELRETGWQIVTGAKEQLIPSPEG
jgi:hypothetical protein